MEPRILFAIVLLAEMALVGGLLLVQPFVARRGLLFGVYVGEERWDGEAARSITRRWIVAMLTAMGLGLVLGELTLILQVGPPPLGALVSVVTLLALSYVVYLRAHFQARALAAPGAPAAAALVGAPPGSLLFPLASLTAALIGGSIAVGYAWMHFTELPAQVPTHFGFSGRPDAWSPRSFASVMTLPLMTLLMGTAMGAAACLTARAKRAIRHPDAGISVSAQSRFRHATANFLAGVVVLMSLMLTVMSVFAVRTALGLADGMPSWLMAVVIVLLAYSLGGTLFLAFRYGQGGARLERSASAPLTNGLANNSSWALGMFYVNRDDPSIFVEKRFGIGYTINFGNPKAVALFVVLLVIIAAVIISDLTMPQTRINPFR